MKTRFQYLSLSAVVALLILVFPQFAHAYTTVSSNINSNTTWTSGSTYYVSTTISVVAGVTLTIEDSVVVKFAPGAYIAIHGNLEAAAGTGMRFFTSRDDNMVGEIIAGSDGMPTSVDWQGLSFYSTSSGQLGHCTVSYATYGIWGSGAFPTISNCTIRSNDIGIYAENTTPNLSSPNTIQNNTNTGIYIKQCTTPTLSNQTLTGHTGTFGAIRMENIGEFTIEGNNTVTGNNWPVRV